MTEVKALKPLIAAENDLLRSEFVVVLTNSIRRRLRMRDELCRTIGLKDLVEHPDEATFYHVLDGIKGIVADTTFDSLFIRAGFDGSVGAEWHDQMVGSAPKRTGRHILEILFDKAVEEFCDWETKWRVHVMAEEATALVHDAQQLALNEPIIPSTGPTPLTTKLTDLPDWYQVSARLRHAMFNDNIKYLGDILEKNECEHRRGHHVGTRTIDELKEFLAQHGYELLPGQSKKLIPEVATFIKWRDTQIE